MKHYADNPRRISEKRFKRLKDTLRRLGDLSGIVHDLNTDQVIGGNQRTRALDLLKRQPVIVAEYDPPTATGTVREGYYEVDGERFAYRAVRWTAEQAREANIAANLEAGVWDFDALAGWDVDELKDWGFDADLLKDWNMEALNLREMMNAGAPDEVNYEELWQGMPEFEQEDNFGAIHSIKVHFATEDDIRAFAELVGQGVSIKTKFIWYPKQERADLLGSLCEDES